MSSKESKESTEVARLREDLAMLKQQIDNLPNLIASAVQYEAARLGAAATATPKGKPRKSKAVPTPEDDNGEVKEDPPVVAKKGRGKSTSNKTKAKAQEDEEAEEPAADAEDVIVEDEETEEPAEEEEEPVADAEEEEDAGEEEKKPLPKKAAGRPAKAAAKKSAKPKVEEGKKTRKVSINIFTPDVWKNTGHDGHAALVKLASDTGVPAKKLKTFDETTGAEVYQHIKAKDEKSLKAWNNTYNVF